MLKTIDTIFAKKQYMICFPNAKINLGLNIVSRRPDGYHNLETIFYPIELKDGLEIIPNECKSTSNAYRLYQTGIHIKGNDSNNLVIKALELIKRNTDKEVPNIDIHLLKKIPSEAGLGGGSSNAAFMLKLLNESFSLGFTADKLIKLASQIGADCPFFIYNQPAFATGIGENLEPININLDDKYLVVVKPNISVSTKDAFSMITPKQPDISLKVIVKSPVTEWKELMKNDFELPIFKKYPEICNIKQQLYDNGAVYAAMSGSGSSVFGIFENKPRLNQLLETQFTWYSTPISKNY